MRISAKAAVLFFLALVILPGSSVSLFAQDFPSKPVEVVVPFPPGGTSDLSIRFFADKWSEFLGQPVVVINKPGAASALGANFVANAKPDGYTLLLGSESPLIVTRVLQKDVGYTLDSFTFLLSYGKGAVFFTVNPASRWKTIGEFIDEARKRPGELTYATHGVGSLSHFIAEVLWRETGVKVTHIPYKSGPEVNAAVLGGHVDLGVPPSFGSLAAKGEIRVLATSGGERAPFAPDIPTLKEQGFKAELTYYSTLVGPKGLSRDVQEKLVSAYAKAYDKYRKDVNDGLIRLELAPISLIGDESNKLMKKQEAWIFDIAGKLGLQK